MSAIKRTTAQFLPEQELAPKTAASADLARLALVHSEAVETARLANFLGRAPYVAAMLAIASGLAAAFTLVATPSAELVAWLLLVLIAVVAIARAYGRTIGAAFERAPLESFAHDLSATLTYAGFAWGAGGFLVLPPTTGPIEALAFATIPPLLVTVLLRSREASLLFLGPAAVLPALAMVLRPLPAGAPAAALTLLAATAIAGLALRVERPLADTIPPYLAELPFA